MEGDVADDDLGIERVPRGIGDLDAHSGQRPAQSVHAVLVDVDRGERPAQLRECAGQRAVTAAQFQDLAGGATDEGGEAGEGRTVGEEVLAEFVTAAMD